MAPQAFKNCATAGQIARAISCGIQRSLPNATVVSVPIADGGDGTLSILLEALHGKRHESTVQNAFGEPHKVEWGVIKETAVVETALICGMATTQALDPMTASTYGVGELIKILLDKGHRNIFIGLGGSTTNDGGTGLAAALGVRFLDSDGYELPLGGGVLNKLAHIDITGLDKRLTKANILVGCDVNTLLLGPKGATHVFSPQKGATPQMVEQLEQGMVNYAAIVSKVMGIDISQMPFGGAAGGMASGLHVFCRGHLVSGAEWILNKIHFADAVKDADLLIVGEGCMDGQTADDKGPVAAAKIAKALGVPVIAIVGTVGTGLRRLKQYGIDKVIASSPKDSGIPDNALALIEKAAEQLNTKP